MVWLYPVGDTFTVFYVKPNLEGLIEVESLPEGSGILRHAADGTFYYEPFPEPEEPEVNPELPITPEPPETLEERIARLESIIEQNNLITVDAVLGVYEELVALREEIAATKGTTDNA
ncbi:hypothetical protein U1P98_18695 [Lysinibacillus irui]|uniref:Uncharacterized protein n=1 Tax=Lysinibacillus irui TaxID=2998077 RepID=A0ABU5NQM3_9BACI|nr:hypothetical protein [Lysinibacillus irui]MEA0556085.1 hypothetical protein [Lysinibacillus irui]MEA0978339.1 hypothetical protein [Lysinibacillus irui]MEA1044493.1 hypothetical protein [Lysinibacillus irui]